MISTLMQPSMKEITIALSIFSSFSLSAQPYIDIGRLSYYYSPEANNKTHPLRSAVYAVNLTLPIEFKKDGDALIINPFLDHKEGKVSAREFNISSKGIMLGFLKKSLAKNWSLLTSVIGRQNKQAEKSLDDAWQVGGLLLATWKQNDRRSFKFGLYYNREFFGNFFMPLVGIDWKVNEKNNIFGVLPGSLIIEHKVNRTLYYGLSFRALTNSWRLETIDPCFSGDCSGKNYLRIEDNQLGLFADIYFLKNFVFTSEAGYTILRKYRFGFKGDAVHHYIDNKSDNFYLKTGVAYRVRFR